MLNDTIICIPSRGRSSILANNKCIFNYIKKNQYALLFVEDYEKEQYFRAIRERAFDIVVCPNIGNIAAKRQFIHEYVKNNMPSITRIVYIDDDIVLYARNKNKSSNYSITGFNRYKMFDMCVNQLSALCGPVFPLTGFHYRLGSQRDSKAFVTNTRIFGIFCVYLPVLNDIKFSFVGDELELTLKEDLYLQYKLLIENYTPITLKSFVFDNSSNVGGCALYRTADKDSDIAKKIYNFFNGKGLNLIFKRKDTRYDKRVDLQIDFNYFKHLQRFNNNVDAESLFKYMKINGYEGNFLLGEC